MKLHLLLTGRCNLDCVYCFQTDRRVGQRLSTATARSALEAALGAGNPPHSVTLSGGEPFLSPTLVRRVVSAIREGPQTSQPIACTVITNGTLVRDADLDFLAEHDVKLQVSFDGAASAQARRGPGTYETVIRLLHQALGRQSDWARDGLSVAMIVQAATVPTLARSVSLLLSVGIREILISPLMTADPGWRRSTREQLEEQVERVVTASHRVWERTGDVPVSFLQSGRRPSRPTRKRTAGALCFASSPESVAVDPDGRAWGCPAFMASVQRLPTLGRRIAEKLELGDVHAPAFSERLTGLPRTAGHLPLLGERAKKWSWRGPCRDCAFFEECFVCPATTTHIPGNRDPHRMPDHHCDFQFTTSKARRRFLGQTGPNWLLAPDWMGRSTEAP